MRQPPAPIPMEHRVPTGRQVSGEWSEGPDEMPLVVTVVCNWTDARDSTRRGGVESSSFLQITKKEFAALALSLGYVPNVKESP